MSKLPLSLRLAAKKFSSTRENFYEYLADALDDKAEIDTEIEIQRQRYAATKNPLAKVFSHWHSNMSQGKFNVAIKGTVPQSDLMIISASERSSTLPEGLRFLAKSIRQMKVMTAAIRSACIFPLFFLLVLFGMMYLFSTMLAPILIQVIPDINSFPTGGKYFYLISMAFKENWPWIISIMISVPILFAFSLNRLTGKAREVLDRYPPYSIYRDYQASLFLVSFSSLIGSGVSFDEALKMIHSQSNKYMQWQITTMLRRYPLNPTKPAKAFEVGLFPQALRYMIEDYGRRNSFGDALKKIGVVAIETTALRVVKSAKLLNNILLLIVGSYLVFSILSVLSIAYEAKTQVQSKSGQFSY
ncbi:type II secretion system F family protein [Limnobacter alexandrii]|uniref:type II secretion system F family protein n=1 Tax=Limnobacter alexandrii TaxID=2570352 RepID=UPI0011096ADB|nr:type II secretion system F family protein [Limnobacter alexandrii]